MLHFQACESHWLRTRGPSCHEQYFVSACHWEHFHMLISINNACSVICLVFFPSLCLAGGWRGPEMSSQETKPGHLHNSFQGGLGRLSLCCWRWRGGVTWQGLPYLGTHSLHAVCWQLGRCLCLHCDGTLLLPISILSDFSQRLFQIKYLGIFWILLNLSKPSLRSRPSRSSGLFVFRLMSALPLSLEEFSKPLICTLPGDKSDEWVVLF